MGKIGETEFLTLSGENISDIDTYSVKQLSDMIYMKINLLHNKPAPAEVLDITQKWLPWAKENNSELYYWLTYKKIYSLYRLNRYEESLNQIDVFLCEDHYKLAVLTRFYTLKALILRLHAGGSAAVEFLDHVLEDISEVDWKGLEQAYTADAAELYRVWAWCLLESSWKNTNKALELMVKSDQLFRKHPDCFNSGAAGEICYTFSLILFRLKHFQEAMEKAEEALSLFIASYGGLSVELCNTYNQLGSIYCSLQEYEKAAESYHSSYLIRKSAYGENNLLTSISYGNYIRTISNRDQCFCRQHKECFLDIVRQRQNGIDPKKIWTGRAWRELALYEQRWPEQVDSQEIETHLENAEVCFLESQNKTEYAITLKAHGSYLEDIDRRMEALSYYLKAEPLITASFAPTHPICNDIQQSILRVQTRS